MSGGFKKNTYNDRKCLACSPNPPTLATQVIRALGTELCQLEEEELTDEVLLKRRKQPSPVRRKKGNPNQKKNPDGEEESKKEKEKEKDDDAQV